MPALTRAGSCRFARSGAMGKTVDRQSRDVVRQVYYAALPSAFVRGLRRLSALVLTPAGLWGTTGLLDFVSGPDGRSRLSMLPPWLDLAAVIAGLSLAGPVGRQARAGPALALP